ncbi:MAG: hypothetical protein JWQ90_2373 [Hydrocarboniphaga sp.]|uniref:hypothetical protein n=1 Tax=Hydrocarboniphaga sp. TaxID=2033016 RepID=UPI0026288A2F|nr:hypothetical protein [Hydrocarboniphaga sp.]MDB5969923.1 hypothetical protein [Hydrocarboniphaga sp.]
MSAISHSAAEGGAYPARPAAVVGRYLITGQFHFLPASERDIDRAKQAVGRILDTYAFARGRHTLVISTLGDVVQMLPLKLAMVDRNLIVCTADASPYEFGRIRSMIGRFDIAAVFGVTAAVLDGLIASGTDPAALFKGKVVWARPDAYARLQNAADIELRRWIELGPALALECRCGDGAHIDSLEWQLDRADDGELLVSSRLDRALSFVRMATGIRATLTRDLCGCGHPGPRVRP